MYRQHDYLCRKSNEIYKSQPDLISKFGKDTECKVNT